MRSSLKTPDGKGLLSVSWDKTVIHWDACWLNSAHEDDADGQKELISTLGSSGGLMESLRQISCVVGRKVRFCFVPYSLSSLILIFIRKKLTPFLYRLMVTGLRLAHGIQLLESGMPILLPCSVFCMGYVGSFESYRELSISQLPMGRAK